MKFHCEYCRELIDTEKDKKCPSCGATYKENKEYKKLLEEQEQQKKLIKEQQDFVHKQAKRIGIAGSVFAIIVPILMFGIMALVIYVGIKNSKKMDNDTFKKIEEKVNADVKDETKSKDEVKTVIVNEEKTSKDYKVRFEKYKLIEQKNDKEFDKLEVNLVIEIISDNFMASGENIYCLVNNVSQNYDFSGSDTFNYIKDKNVPTSKKMTYYVPKGLKSFDIKYGNEVSFHVDIEND